MDHSCYRCAAAVEDGVAFCPHCNSPQIRVLVKSEGLSPDETIQAGPETTSPYPRSDTPARIDWPPVLASVFFGLIISFVLSAVFRGSFLIGMLATGYLAVFLHHRRHPFQRLTLGSGARLGAFSGVFGFVVLAMISVVAAAFSHAGPEIHGLMLKAIQDYGGRNSDPQMQQILEFYRSRDGLILLLALGSFFMFAMFTALSTVGGMIGAATLERKQSL